MNNMLALAIKIAATEFLHIVDKGGNPYIMHCIRVMNNVDQDDEELMQIAVLHDVIEDTNCTIQHLRIVGFSERVLIALSLLTHNPDEDYDSYIKRIALNKDATAVKLADLKDNSDITRLKGLRKKDFDRMEKYHRAYTY